MNLQELRDELHASVDRLFDAYEARSGAGNVAPSPDAPFIVRGDEIGPWNYTWPGGAPEPFSRATWYEVQDGARSYRVLVGWTTREAWGRVDRARAVVFGQSVSGTLLYPWTEFVETDDDRYAAPVPDPSRPRAMLRDADRLPSVLSGTHVERSDRLFDSIAEGPSLRLVVEAGDEEAMVRHGYWVAGLRGRR